MRRLFIERIRMDGGTQSRATLDDGHIRDLAEAIEGGAELPPVVVFYDGSDNWLADGFHRVRAYDAAGCSEVPVDVRQGTVRDAVLFSVGANATHGLRRSNADKRRAVEVLLRDEQWRTWSDREIARVCGVGHPLVADARRQLEDSSSPTPEPDIRRGADGVERNVPKRAPREPSPPSDPAPLDFGDDPTEDDFEEPAREDAPEEEDEAPASGARASADPAPPARRHGADQAMSAVDVAVACLRGLTEQERSAALRAVGAVTLPELWGLREQRDRDPEYASMRRLSEPLPTSPRSMRMVAAVLDGADVALAALGLNWDSTADEVRRAYRERSLTAHPDRGGDAGLMVVLSKAHSLLRSYLEPAA